MRFNDRNIKSIGVSILIEGCLCDMLHVGSIYEKNILEHSTIITFYYNIKAFTICFKEYIHSAALQYPTLEITKGKNATAKKTININGQ